jgi:uridine phosphorylase
LQGLTGCYRRVGLLNYEMEAGTLVKMAGAYGIRAGCVCAVLADRNRGKGIEAAGKERAIAAAIEVALDGLGRWRGSDPRLPDPDALRH